MAVFETSLLEWDNFAQNISNAFQDMRRREDLFDVTLSCSESEGRTLQAHKSLLSASSSFFQKVLCEQIAPNSQTKPYIYLKGISFSDLSLVLDFVYNRKVSVPKHNLDSFLSVARELEINGLTKKGEKCKNYKSEEEEIEEVSTSSKNVLNASTSEIANSDVKRTKKVNETKAEKIDEKPKKKKLDAKEETNKKGEDEEESKKIKKKKHKPNVETSGENQEEVHKSKKKKLKLKEVINEESEEDIAIVEVTSKKKESDPIVDSLPSNKTKKIQKKFPNVIHVKTPGSSDLKSEQQNSNGKRKNKAPKRTLEETSDSDPSSSPEKLDENSETVAIEPENEDPVAKKLQKLEKYFAKEAEKDKEKFELIIQNLSQNLDGKNDNTKTKETSGVNNGTEKSTKSSKMGSKKHPNKSLTDDSKDDQECEIKEAEKPTKSPANDKSSSKKKSSSSSKHDEPKHTDADKSDFWNISWPPEKGTMIATLKEDTFCLGKVESKLGKEGTVKVSYMKPYRQPNSTEEGSIDDEYWVWPEQPDVRPTQKNSVLGTGPIIEFVTKVGENLDDDLYNLTNFQQLAKVAKNSKSKITNEVFDLPLV